VSSEGGYVSDGKGGLFVASQHGPVLIEVGMADALLASHDGRSAGDLRAEMAVERAWLDVGFKGSSE